jgi:hypothetical protein
MDAMLTEEALILLATLAASGMLALGVMELVWPTVPRRGARRPRASLPPLDSAFVAEGTRGARGSSGGDVLRARLGAPPLAVPEVPIRVVEAADVAAAPTADEVRGHRGAAAVDTETASVIADRGAPAGAESDAAAGRPEFDRSVSEAVSVPVADRIDAPTATVEAPTAVAAPIVTEEPPREPAPPTASSEIAAEPATPLPAAPARARPERRRTIVADRGRTVLPIETCLAMYNEHRYTEVVSLGSAALEVHARMAAVSHRPDEAAALQDLVGLAKQELGDREGARAAFGTAIANAAPAARPPYIRHLLTLVRGIVDGVNVKDDDGIRVRELRACLAAIASALDVASGDESLLGARQAVLEAVGALCDRLVPFALDDDGDPAAKALLLEVAGDERMAGPWLDRLRERLGASPVTGTTPVSGAAGTTTVSTAEVGQLTVFAVRAVQEGREDEALEALERAEHLAAAMTGPGADERREELERRLWWGYTKVGLRRLERGAFDTALDPFFRALRLGRVDSDRLSETRGALVRALDGVAETTLPALQALRETDAPAAARETARVAGALQSWAAHGLTEQDLGEAHDRITRLGHALA